MILIVCQPGKYFVRLHSWLVVKFRKSFYSFNRRKNRHHKDHHHKHKHRDKETKERTQRPRSQSHASPTAHPVHNSTNHNEKHVSVSVIPFASSKIQQTLFKLTDTPSSFLWHKCWPSVPLQPALVHVQRYGKRSGTVHDILQHVTQHRHIILGS